MSLWGRHVKGVLVLALAATVVAAPAAFSKTPKHETRLTISFLANIDAEAKDDFSGKVKSTRRCRVNRRVRVFRVLPGKDPRVFSARSNADAQWHRAVRVEAGRYYAKGTRETRRWRGQKHICLGDRTRSTTIPG